MNLGNGFMITVTNIETFHDHFAHYEKVDVVAVVGVLQQLHQQSGHGMSLYS